MKVNFGYKFFGKVWLDRESSVSLKLSEILPRKEVGEKCGLFNGQYYAIKKYINYIAIK